MILVPARHPEPLVFGFPLFFQGCRSFLKSSSERSVGSTPTGATEAENILLSRSGSSETLPPFPSSWLTDGSNGPAAVSGTSHPRPSSPAVRACRRYRLIAPDIAKPRGHDALVVRLRIVKLSQCSSAAVCCELAARPEPCALPCARAQPASNEASSKGSCSARPCRRVTSTQRAVARALAAASISCSTSRPVTAAPRAAASMA